MMDSRFHGNDGFSEGYRTCAEPVEAVAELVGAVAELVGAVAELVEANYTNLNYSNI